ncbi:MULTISPECIES: hypothetical protein [Streptomyces]|uniref:hypothetical protein n=1 Tax=Streptomyces TaxID=1883 RepID=UPI00292CBF4E|nr:hypothetical protein [Streptomyces sp. NEAU-HV9]
MAENEDDIANLKPFYAARLAEDLERNAQEQERLTSEMAALQGRLETLRHNQVLLRNMQQALGDTQTSDEVPAPSDSHASVPHQADRNAPTLRNLVVGYLSQEGEPRSALAVTAALAEEHKDRGIKITVVRSTLEAMVARGQVRRSKQGKSVFYTATADSAADTRQAVTV